jgi:hypothetical protein
MRKKSVRIGALVVLICAFAVSFGVAYQEAQAWDSLCHAPYCFEFCLCQMEFQTGAFINGECNLNVCDPPCNGVGVPCL